MSSLRSDNHKKATFRCTLPTDDPVLLPFLDLVNFSCPWRRKINENQRRVIENMRFTGMIELLKAFTTGSWVSYEVVRSDLALQDRIVPGNITDRLPNLRFEEGVCTCGKQGVQ